MNRLRGPGPPERRAVDLGALIEDSLNLLRAAAPRHVELIAFPAAAP